MSRIAVVLDFGSASPMSILAAARGLGEVAFVCDLRLPYVRERYEDIADLAEVVDVTGLAGAALADRVARFDPDAITTFSEHQIVRTAGVAATLGLVFHSPATARALTDKLTQRRVLASAGLPRTACRPVRTVGDVRSALAEVGLPAVLKPRSGAASAYTCRVNSAPEAIARVREFGTDPAPDGPTEFVLEQLLAGDPAVAGPDWADYVSIESVTARGHVQHAAVTGKFPLAEPFRETGYVVPDTLSQASRDAVLAVCTTALHALGVRDGVTHVEVKLGPTGPRVIEVNGRLGGYVADLVRRSRGLDLVRAALLVALGQTPVLRPGAHRRHAFQYFLTPPMGAVRVRRIEGVEALGREPGIQVIEWFKRAGDPVDWRRGTLAYVGIVYGSASSHAEVLRLTALIRHHLRIEYDTPGAGTPEAD